MGGIRLYGVAISVIQSREKCVVCLSVELQQIECTLTADVTRLVAVRNKNILCHSIQLFFSFAALYCHALQILRANVTFQSRALFNEWHVTLLSAI